VYINSTYLTIHVGLYIYIGKKVNYFPMLMDPYGVADLCLITSRSHKTTDTGLVHRVVCPFTPQLSLYSLTNPEGMACWVGAGTQQQQWDSWSQVQYSTSRPLEHI